MIDNNQTAIEDLTIREDRCSKLVFGFVSQKYICGSEETIVDPTKCTKGNICSKLGEKNA